MGVEHCVPTNRRSFAERKSPIMASQMLLGAFAVMMVLMASVHQAQAGYYADGAWGQAHATYYGGVDASGTQGGACGFGNLYTTGYGVQTTALSTALFNNGLSCGACYQISCDSTGSSYCYGGNTITVTATNFCPPGSLGGWCDPPRSHFDLAHPMFIQIAQEVGGVVPVNYRRVSCLKAGGMRYTINGNPWFLLILVTNVGGAGDVQQLFVKAGNSQQWYPCARNWGMQWQFTGNSGMMGQTLSFRTITSDGSTLDSIDAAPSNWGFGQTFEGINY